MTRISAYTTNVTLAARIGPDANPRARPRDRFRSFMRSPRARARARSSPFVYLDISRIDASRAIAREYETVRGYTIDLMEDQRDVSVIKNGDR